VDWPVHAGLLFVQLTWGAFHVTAKAVLDTLDPLALAGLRVVGATPILLLLAWRQDRVMPGLRDLPWLALLGSLGVFANQLLFIHGLNHTTASNAAILMPSIPVFAAGAAIVLGIERANLRRLGGIALAVAGALVMLEPGRFELGDATKGNLLVLANCLSYALFLVFMRPVLRRLPAATVIAWSFVFGGAGVMAFAWRPLAAVDLASVSVGVWWGMAYIIIVPTALNYLISTWAVARSTPSLVAAYTTLQPLSAVLLASLFLAESVGWAQLIGGLLIVAGLQRVAAAGGCSGKP
jgi:drug/metabolite transporter (DMT)-like permease